MIIQDVVTWIYDLLINVCNISCFACKFFAALFCTLLFSCMHAGYQPQLSAIHALVANNLRKVH